VAEGASETELATAEGRLGVRLVSGHRSLLSEEDGWQRWFGSCFLMLYATADLVDVNQEIERHPGFVAFASNGSRELLGFDMRRANPPIVMIDITSAGWHEALFQADSFGEFMAQRLRHEDLRWDTPYTAEVDPPVS
jgi:hypothetical protein